MSRAFVREPDGMDVVDELPELPQEPIPNYVTPEGMAALEAWAESLKKERYELKDHDESIVDASKLAHVLRDLRYVEGRIDHAVVVDMAEQPQDEVAFGACIVAKDENGETHAWRIVGENQSDLDAALVSWVSPLARALHGAQVGDVVTWRRPAGDLELEVKKISYP
ncbi:MAG: GreA/GreB family elongation factor [Rhodospirillales bacterium]|nr:GreA/GreB family elongation factor [Rhodospirillales bacterium]